MFQSKISVPEAGDSDWGNCVPETGDAEWEYTQQKQSWFNLTMKFTLVIILLVLFGGCTQRSYDTPVAAEETKLKQLSARHHWSPAANSRLDTGGDEK